MRFIFNFETIDYDYFNSNSNKTILFLHGWGGDKNSFFRCATLLKSKYNILTITIPTIQPTFHAWTMLDYCELVRNILTVHNIRSVIIICHSFGFRVACLLNGIIKIEKIVVTGGAGLKRVNVFKRIERQNNAILLKKKRFKYLFDNLASADYKLLSTVNKQTFKNVVNTINNNMIKFSCPMLLFWGKRDKETPVWMAKKIAKRQNEFYKKPNKIERQKAVQKNINVRLVITNSDHFAYINKSATFLNEVVRFLEE